MKTKNYQMAKSLMTLVIVALISMVSSTTNGHESPTSVKFAGGEKSEVSTVTTSKAISGTLQNWIESGTYWENVENANFEAAKTEEVNDSNLLDVLENWMSNGLFWNDSERIEIKDDISLSLKSIISTGSYWNPENCHTSN